MSDKAKKTRLDLIRERAKKALDKELSSDSIEKAVAQLVEHNILNLACAALGLEFDHWDRSFKLKHQYSSEQPALAHQLVEEVVTRDVREALKGLLPTLANGINKPLANSLRKAFRDAYREAYEQRLWSTIREEAHQRGVKAAETDLAEFFKETAEGLPEDDPGPSDEE